jgi:hypothetical protein
LAPRARSGRHLVLRQAHSRRSASDDEADRLNRAHVDGDGYKEQTAWAGPTDGLLVIDLAANGAAGSDGQINQAKEIAFAQWTSDPNDTDLQALRTVFDTNRDGKLTGADARFGEFRVWKDANQNGTVESGELQTLPQAGITQVNLTSDGNAYLLPDGSEINGTGSFVQNGVTRSLADAGLAYDTSGFQRVATSQGFNSRSFARRKRNACVQRGASYLQLNSADPPHTRAIHRQDKRSACG